jgi:hypothetical protein
VNGAIGNDEVDLRGGALAVELDHETKRTAQSGPARATPARISGSGSEA